MPTPRRFPGIALLAVALTAAMLTASCKDKSGTPSVSATASGSAMAATYESTFCGDVGDWVTAMQDTTTKLPTSSSDPAQFKEGLNTYLDALAQTTTTLQAKLQQAGPPPADGGTEAQQTFLDSLDAAQQKLTSVRAEIETIDVKDQETLKKTFFRLTALPPDFAAAAVVALEPLTTADPTLASDPVCKSLIRFFSQQ